MKKLFTLLLATIICCALQAAQYSGQLGKDISWSLNTTTGLLTITGSGSMQEAFETYGIPWEDHSDAIKQVIIKEGITSIGNYAFSSYEHLSSVTLPNSLDSICTGAFSSTAIQSLKLPNNLHYIGQTAFANCQQLRSLTLSDALETIPSSMCSNCIALAEINIPNSVKTIESTAFYGCSSLTKVTGCQGIRRVDNEAFLSSALELDDANWKDNVFYVGNMCIRSGDHFSGSASIREGTTVIAEYAFMGKPLTSISFPNSLLYINDMAFSECSKLTTVSFGSGLLEIGNEAFQKTAITSLQLPDQLQKINSFAFQLCKQLTTVSLGNGLHTIEDNAFYLCSKLTSIVIPDNVVTIKDGAFSGCSSLTDVTIGKSVENMYLWEVFDANTVKHLTFNAKHITTTNSSIIVSASALETVIFGNEVEVIPDIICNSAKKLTSVTLPTSLKEIGEFTFEGCTSLKEITIPDNVTTIGAYAFYGCSSMKKVTIRKSIKKIDDLAFDETPIKTLVWNAIHYEDTKPLSFPQLTEITFGDQVEFIPASLCSEAVGLTSVTIPASVTEIGAWAFYSCEKLATVTCEGSTPPTLKSLAFSDIAENAILRVPCGSLAAYRKSTWKNYFSRFEEYFPYTYSILSADETMGSVVIGDFNCSEGTLSIEAKAQTGYAFVAWSDGNTDASRLLQVTQDTTLYATFQLLTFTIRFIDWDGTELQAKEVAYNTIPSAPTTPIRAATAQYTYTFKDWNPEITAALADTDYIAQYDSVVNKYAITFLNEDGTLLNRQEWEYGSMPSCTEPTKENSEDYAYHFEKWEPELTIVTGEAIYKASFRAVPIHTLVFLDWNGDELGIVRAEEGTTAIAPKDPEREGYVFTNWSRDLNMITHDQYVIALYQVDKASALEVRFVDDNNQVVQTSYLTDAAPEAPIVQAKIFAGWQAISGDITDGIVIQATYEPDIKSSTAPNQINDVPRKVIRNQRVYILHGDKAYTIQGVAVHLPE